MEELIEVGIIEENTTISSHSIRKFFYNQWLRIGGTKLWNVTWGGNAWDAGYGIAVDAGGGAIYCTGAAASFGAVLPDIALLKFGYKPLDPPELAPITPDPDADGIIELSWNAVTDAEMYYIYRDLLTITSVMGLTPKYVVTETTYNDTLATNGTYYYVIVAGAAFGNSSISNFENITVAIPPKPGGIPGFGLVYLVIGWLVLIYIVQRRSLRRTPS